MHKKCKLFVSGMGKMSQVRLERHALLKVTKYIKVKDLMKKGPNLVLSFHKQMYNTSDACLLFGPQANFAFSWN